MKIKSAKMPPELSNSRLFWAFDHTNDNLEKNITFKEIDIDILNELRESENLDNVPDPLSNVLGVTFEPVELLKIDRSHSPMTGRSKHKPGSSTSRTHNIKIRDLSHESNTLREKKSTKDKYKNYLGSKYNRYTGRNTGKNHYFLLTLHTLLNHSILSNHFIDRSSKDYQMKSTNRDSGEKS